MLSKAGYPEHDEDLEAIQATANELVNYLTTKAGTEYPLNYDPASPDYVKEMTLL